MKSECVSKVLEKHFEAASSQSVCRTLHNSSYVQRRLKAPKTERILSVTDLKDDDEGESGSQDVPELQGEVVGHCAPGWRSVVSVPAVSGLDVITGIPDLPHVEPRQAAVHVALQTPGGGEEDMRLKTRK